MLPLSGFAPVPCSAAVALVWRVHGAGARLPPFAGAMRILLRAALCAAGSSIVLALAN